MGHGEIVSDFGFRIDCRIAQNEKAEGIGHAEIISNCEYLISNLGRHRAWSGKTEVRGQRSEVRGQMFTRHYALGTAGRRGEMEKRRDRIK